MSNFAKYFFLLPALIGCSGGTQSDQNLVTSNTPPKIMNTNMSTNWESKTFKVVSAANGETVNCVGWTHHMTGVRQMPYGPHEFRFPIDGFFVPTSKALWIGPPQEFYLIEHEAVTGVRVVRNMGLVFWPSMFKTSDLNIETLDSLKARMENHVTYGSVNKHEDIVSDSRRSGNRALDFPIDLRTIFTKHLFYSSSSSGMDAKDSPSIVSQKAAAGVLEIGMTSYSGKERGTVWVRIADKTLLRAVENGVQVFPVETKQPAP